MTNAATWPLNLPDRVSRTRALVAIAVATFAFLALAFVVGRWSVGSSAQRSPALSTPAHAAQVLDCRPHSYC